MPFIILTVVSGAVSLYAIHQYNNTMVNIIESVSTAKNIQIELQKQFNNWKILIVEGTSFEVYKQKIHEYSYNTQNIQNALFNLELMSKDMPDIHDKIISFTQFYQHMNDDFLSHIVNLNENNVQLSKKAIENSFDNENKSLEMINAIVRSIDSVSSEKIQIMNTYYLIIGFISFGVLTGFTFIISWFSSRLLNRFKEKLEFKVKRRTEELEKANDKISLSEQKYRFLIESSDDIIFTMKENGEVTAINNAIKKYLKIKPANIINTTLYDYLFFEDGNNSFKKQILIKNIEQSLYKKEAIRFHAEFKTHSMIEPLELVVSLESVNVNGRMEVIGKASKITDNELADSFVNEHVKYEIANSLLLADEITHRIVLNLRKFLPHNVIIQLRLAISELLINAIEHGNLEISYEDKMVMMQADSYFEHISQKINDAGNKNKKVRIEFLLNSEKMIIKITDQGDGFDHKKYLNKSSENPEESFLQHGRGIALAKQIFDDIRYNDKGNQVLCIKYLSAVDAFEVEENAVRAVVS